MPSFDDVTETGTAVLSDLGDRASTIAQAASNSTKKIQKQALKNLKNLQQATQENGASVLSDLGDRASTVAQAASASTKKMQKQAQKNLQNLKQATQENLESGWSTARSKWEDGSQQVRENLAQIGSNVQDAREASQKRAKANKRARARARTVFRWGLVIGVVLVLLYTPISGAEVRQRIADLWRN